MEKLELRPFQERFVDVVLNKAQTTEPKVKRPKVVVANVHPGSGKTLSVLAAADKLYPDFIDNVVIFVPRINLAHQFEQDWAEFRERLPWTASLGPLCHRDNTPPLIRGNESGYITTYDSLISAPQIHIEAVKRKRSLVVFDEAQQLGVDYDRSLSSTQSAKWAKAVGDEALLAIVMSGTPVRADGSRLLYAVYENEPDSGGWLRLLPDVEATYQDGVRDGYLRPFEAILHDGKGIWQELGSEQQELTLSEMEEGIYKIIRQEGYWKPIVDKFVDKLSEVQDRINPKLCGLIAAYNQQHAREIKDYLFSRHRRLSILIAISEDGKEAHQNLRQFREGRADVLITVQMAHVGYDHKPISVILPLTGIRADGYLRQLFARGLRMMPDIERDIQNCYAIVPDDPQMHRFIERLREESKFGVQLREALSTDKDGNRSELQPTLGQGIDAWLTEIRAKGLNPTGDLDSSQWDEVERLRAKYRVAEPATKLVALWRELSDNVLQPAQAQSPKTNSNRPFRTKREQETDARRRLKKLTDRCDYTLGQDHGTTNGRLWRRFGRRAEQCTLEELNQRIELVARWIRNGGFYD